MGVGTPWRSSSGTHEVLVAPCCVLGLVAKLFQSSGLKLSGLKVFRVREDNVVHHLGHPAILSLLEGLARPGDHRRRPSHELDIFLRRLLGRQGMEVRRVRIVPAQVPLIDGLGVVIHRAVIAPVVPLPVEAPGKLHHLGDLEHRVAVVHEPERLVMDVLVEVALLPQVIEDLRLSPRWPLVLSEDHHRSCRRREPQTRSESSTSSLRRGPGLPGACKGCGACESRPRPRTGPAIVGNG